MVGHRNNFFNLNPGMEFGVVFFHITIRRKKADSLIIE